MKKIEEMTDLEFSEYIEKLDKSFEKEDNIKKNIILERRNRKSSIKKYIHFATGFVYTLLSPIILLLGIYFILKKVYKFQTNEKIIIFLIILGLITGYVNLYKDIQKITKEKGKKDENKS